jgi:hypothetical protein
MPIGPSELDSKTQLSYTFFAFEKEDEFAGVERRAGGFPQGGAAGLLSGPTGARSAWRDAPGQI